MKAAVFVLGSGEHACYAFAVGFGADAVCQPYCVDQVECLRCFHGIDLVGVGCKRVAYTQKAR